MGEPGRIDLNTATVARLADIPGLGEATARRIIEWREMNGGFHHLNEVNLIPGVHLDNHLLAHLAVKRPPEENRDHRDHHRP